MHIPSVWVKRAQEFRDTRNRLLNAEVWGWGESESEAGAQAERRLARLMERVGRGEPFPDKYGYGDRPLREEIVEVINDPLTNTAAAVITRNQPGALVLNTADLLFLDVDTPRESLGGFFKRLFGRGAAQPSAVERLQTALRENSDASFRIYRTAAGLRAIAVDRAFQPEGPEAQGLMRATQTDPAFARLCRVQKSFRARLTPKSWRCGLEQPPGRFPRTDPGAMRGFEEWLRNYEETSKRYATCDLVGTVGSGAARGVNEQLVALHDAVTRCGEGLPLA